VSLVLKADLLGRRAEVLQPVLVGLAALAWTLTSRDCSARPIGSTASA